MTHVYKYPRAALSVDCVVFGRESGRMHVLLIQRRAPPHAGQWALPGGFLELDETLEQAARRELREETGIALEQVEQLRAFDAIDRDPRERVISVAHVATIDIAEHPLQAGDDASAARWFDLEQLPELAFDHGEILRLARRTRGL